MTQLRSNKPKVSGIFDTFGITRSRVWASFFRHGYPDNDLDRSLVMNSNVLLHLMPVKVSRHSLRAAYSLGLGVMSLVLFGLLTFTGVVLMFVYIPSVERAYPSMLELITETPLGLLYRNTHRWAADLMVVVVFLHMLRVFFTGGYKPPREFNWLMGVGLLLLTLFANFTGYLLPWDQLAYWAITVGTSIAGYAPLFGEQALLYMRGGPEVGQGALIRFYTLHIALIPLLMAGLISIHLWRVRKDGGLSNPKENR